MRYGKVMAGFWPETRDWPEDEQLLRLFVISTKHGNSEGLSEIPVGYIAHDLGWTVERVNTAMAALVERGAFVVDGDWILNVGALQDNQPAGGPQIKGAANAIQDVPRDNAAYAAFYRSVSELEDGSLLKALTEFIGGPIGLTEDAVSDTPSRPSRGSIEAPSGWSHEASETYSNPPAPERAPAPAPAPAPSPSPAPPAGARTPAGAPAHVSAHEASSGSIGFAEPHRTAADVRPGLTTFGERVAS